MLQNAIQNSPQLKRGQIWCHSCGKTQKTNSYSNLICGWPKCCGYTMSLDSPEERKKYEKKEKEPA